MDNTSTTTEKLPSDLGFDGNKFPTFREYQLEAAEAAAISQKNFFLLEAPTGAGKSIVGLAVHALKQSHRSIYLVSTKQLQDQIAADFDIPILKGRNNYPCLCFPDLFPEVTSEICREYKGSKDCVFEDTCPYLIHKRQALAAPVCILNYALFLAEANFSGSFSGTQLLIMDEVDTVEDHLMSFVELLISSSLIRRMDIGYPQLKTKVDSWCEWLEVAHEIVEKEIDKMGLAAYLPPKRFKAYIQLKRTCRKMEYLLYNLNSDWVLEYRGEGNDTSLVFKPVKVAPFAKEVLWKHTKQAIGMSATIMGSEAMAMELGLHSWDAEFHAIPSLFPVENRRVIYDPVAEVTRKNMDEAKPKLTAAVEGILEKHPTEKVLLHTVSYDLRNHFMQTLKLKSHRMFTHDKNDRVQVLEAFKAHVGPAILISPSMERGVDLPGDLCRVVIVAKLPYPSLGNPQVAQRLHGSADGNLWYARKTARLLVQMTGRATRSKSDWSVSYLLDEQFGKLVARNGHIFPKWWKESVGSAGS